MSLMYREIEENIIRNHFYFELLGKLNENKIIVPDEIFKPFIESLYNNEIKELMNEALKHNHRRTRKSEILTEEINNKINEFVAKQKERSGN